MKEAIAFLFGFGWACNALLFLPQLIAVVRKRSSQGVSLITFGGFSVLQAIGVAHGYLQHDNSLVFGMGTSLAACGTLTVLTVYFRLQERAAR